MKTSYFNNLLLFIIVITVTSCSSNKQLNSNKLEINFREYYKLIRKSDSFFVIKNYNESYKILHFLNENKSLTSASRLNPFRSLLLSKHYLKKDITREDFENYISVYGFTDFNLKHDKILLPYYKQSGISQKEYEKLRDTYLNSLDLELRKEIILMTERDQYIRKHYKKEDKYQRMDIVDQQNQEVIKDLFNRNIYPNSKKIGNFFVDFISPDIELLLLHTQDSLRINYILPKIKQFIKEKRCSPYVYANLIDQYQIYHGKQQLYGTFNVKEIEKKDFKKYNANRNILNIGLPSIEYDVWKSKLN